MITEIQANAFDVCQSLSKINLPESLEVIGDGAFLMCQLLNVKLPDSIRSIGSYAFVNTSMDFSSLPGNLEDVADQAFKECAIGPSLTLPPNLKTVGWESFAGNYSLKHVTFNEGLQSIGASAFGEGVMLTSIELPSSLISLGENAFNSSTDITSINIPANLQNIGSKAFNVTNVTSITVDPANTFWFVSNNCLIHKKSKFLLMGLSNSTIPSDGSVVSIENSAFYNATLPVVVIPDSVKKIGSYAFDGCAIEELTLPNATLASNAFASAFNTTTTSVIRFTGSMAEWCAIPNLYSSNLVQKRNRSLFVGGQEVTGNVILPDNVTILSDYNFYYMTSITGITIPDSVTSIGSQVFSGCSGLTSAVIGNGVASIGRFVFNGCNAMTEISIPFVGSSLNNPTNVNFFYLFGYQLSAVPSTLKSVTITGGTEIGAYAFNGCKYLEVVKLFTAPVTLKNSAFGDCNALKEVHTKSISDWCRATFETWYANPLFTANKLYINNQLVTELVIPEEITELSAYAFARCKDIVSISGLEHVTAIGEECFELCSNMVGTCNFQSVTQIGGLAFFGCVKLEGTPNFPSTLQLIGSEAFSGCTGLTGDLIIPDSVQAIGRHAFYACTGLNGNLHLPAGLKAIRAGTFSGCTELTGDLVIPDSVAEIAGRSGLATSAEGAFYGCSKLTSLTLPKSLTTLGGSVFSGCSNIQGTLIIPDSLEVVESYTFYGLYLVTQVEMGSSVKSIKENAFIVGSNSGKAIINMHTATSPALENANVFGVYVQKIYIPTGAMSAYSADTNWNQLIDKGLVEEVVA